MRLEFALATLIIVGLIVGADFLVMELSGLRNAPISNSKGDIQETGTVTYVGLEGGFFGIVGDDGKHYDPMNLPQNFRVPGLRIRFTANWTDYLSFHMWGYIVILVSIERL